MKQDNTPLGKFKRELRNFGIHPRIKFLIEFHGKLIYLRVCNLQVPHSPKLALRRLTKADVGDRRLYQKGSSPWILRFGESFGFKSDGWDEDGNVCFELQPEHIDGCWHLDEMNKHMQ